MLLKTAINKYRKTDKEIFVTQGIYLSYFDKNINDIKLKYNTTIINSRVKKIDESEGCVTIFL